MKRVLFGALAVTQLMPAEAGLASSWAYPPAGEVTPGQRQVIESWAARPMDDWEGWFQDPTKGGKLDPGGPAKSAIANSANAKLTVGVDAERVNQVLMSARPYSEVGTHYTGPFGLMRLGDYDFALTGLTTVLYRHWDNPLLRPETKKHLLTVVLNQEGNDHMQPRWGYGVIPETENHVLMTESSRYLKNQLVAKHGLEYAHSRLPLEAYDNEKNGFNAWFVNHISEFTRSDFDEYNSRPYQRCSMKPLQNLYEFAEDPEVKLAARITLDYMAAKFAIQSSDFRRIGPFRRRKEYNGADNVVEKDSEAARYAMLAGLAPGFREALTAQAGLGEHDILQAATLSYKPPAAVMDLMVNKGHNPYFAVAHHRNTEIYYAEENFSIAAGGHYARFDRMPLFGYVSDQENANVMPTTVLLKGVGPKLSEAIHFLGRGDSDRLNNTGVYENFAFGIRPQIPASMLAKARTAGPWKFIEVGDTYVAIHTQSQPSPRGYAPSVGFCEVVDRREFPSLLAFQTRVSRLNGGKFGYYGTNTYTTTRGKMITFEMAEAPKSGLTPPLPDRIDQWGVRQVWDHGKSVTIETNFDQWPLVRSRSLRPDTDGYDNDFPMRADGTGQILIHNQHLGKSLFLSLADHVHPIRIEQDAPLVNLAEKARVEKQVSPSQVDVTLTLPTSEPVSYLSLRWDRGARPENVKLFIHQFGRWNLVEERKAPFKSETYDFRTDFDASRVGRVEAVRFVATGRQLKLKGTPEAYRGM